MGVLSERPTEMELMLKGYGLTLAKFYYMLPDHPLVIAPTFIWQEYDQGPDFSPPL